MSKNLNLNCLKLSDSLKKALDGYGERSDYKLPTASSLASGEMEEASVYNLIQVCENNSKEDKALLDSLLVAAFGWGTESLRANSREEGITITDYIEQQMAEDDTCLYEQTCYFFDALESLAKENPENAEKQLAVANEFFIELCGSSPDELMLMIFRSIARAESLDATIESEMSV